MLHCKCSNERGHQPLAVLYHRAVLECGTVSTSVEEGPVEHSNSGAINNLAVSAPLTHLLAPPPPPPGPCGDQRNVHQRDPVASCSRFLRDLTGRKFQTPSEAEGFENLQATPFLPLSLVPPPPPPPPPGYQQASTCQLYA